MATVIRTHLPSITPEQLATKSGQSFLTYRQAAEYAEISEGQLHMARAWGMIDPDAQLLSGGRGRPSLLFRKGTVQTFKRTIQTQARDARKRAESALAAAIAAAQTDAGPAEDVAVEEPELTAAS